MIGIKGIGVRAEELFAVWWRRRWGKEANLLDRLGSVGGFAGGRSRACVGAIIIPGRFSEAFPAKTAAKTVH
jgi:hypothetical protein